MLRNVLISTLAIIFILYGVIFAVNQLANATSSLTPQATPDAATLEKAKNEFLANICSGHGGVNCSVLNSDASVVCNDGTVDESLPTIYAVPQCQQAIENAANQQSDFMDKSGCYPPSEMTCTTEQSYQNLYKIGLYILSSVSLIICIVFFKTKADLFFSYLYFSLYFGFYK